MKRRSFLVASAAGAVSALTSRIAFAAAKKPAGAVVKVSTLKTGRPQAFATSRGGRPRNLLITKVSATKYAVLDATCTHEGCRVNVKGSGLECPCHLARYNAAGVVQSGPAPRDLAAVPYTIKNGYLCLK